MTNLIDAARCAELFGYDSISGLITNKKTGKVYQSVNGSGYLIIWADGQSYLSHRIAWLLTYGEFPKCEIDHINRIRSDNRICNLREVSRSQNQRNTSTYKNSVSKLKGASYRKKYGNWMAHISINGKYVHLGYFKTAIEAHYAYLYALNVGGNNENRS